MLYFSLKITFLFKRDNSEYLLSLKYEGGTNFCSPLVEKKFIYLYSSQLFIAISFRSTLQIA